MDTWTERLLVVLAMGVLWHLWSRRRSPGAGAGAGPVPGELYAVRRPRGRFAVVKVLATDAGVVHLRLYKERFDAPPAPADLDRLSIDLGLEDLDAPEGGPIGLGVAHLPVDEGAFLRGRPVLLAVEELTPEELAPLTGGEGAAPASIGGRAGERGDGERDAEEDEERGEVALRVTVGLRARLAAGDVSGEELAGWAGDALAAGHDSPALRLLAGLDLGPATELANVLPHFERALGELGVPRVERETSARAHLRELAQALLAGEASVEETLELAHRRVLAPLDHPADLMPWCRLRDGLAPDACTPIDPRRVEAEALELARRTAAGTG